MKTVAFTRTVNRTNYLKMAIDVEPLADPKLTKDAFDELYVTLFPGQMKRPFDAEIPLGGS